MIQLTPHMRVLVAVEPVDFRQGIDGLVRVCRERLVADPFSGAVYVFHNRRRTSLKLLVFDGQGFWLCQKRLSVGHFNRWPESQQATVRLRAHATGRGKADFTKVANRSKKYVLGLPLTRDFRQQLVRLP